MKLIFALTIAAVAKGGSIDNGNDRSFGENTSNDELTENVLGTNMRILAKYDDRNASFYDGEDGDKEVAFDGTKDKNDFDDGRQGNEVYSSGEDNGTKGNSSDKDKGLLGGKWFLGGGDVGGGPGLWEPPNEGSVGSRTQICKAALTKIWIILLSFALYSL